MSLHLIAVRQLQSKSCICMRLPPNRPNSHEAQADPLQLDPETHLLISGQHPGIPSVAYLATAKNNQSQSCVEQSV